MSTKRIGSGRHACGGREYGTEGPRSKPESRWNITEEKVQKLKQSTCGKAKAERRKWNCHLETNTKGGKKGKKILTDEVKENEKKVPSSKTFEKLNPSNISPGEFQRDDSLVLSHRQHRQRQERAQPEGALGSITNGEC